ncbi:MAG: hypothetical protein HFE78_05570 [Clostridiales bacterium]|nr:hypothetical protein [Clostridiales bacterium]
MMLECDFGVVYPVQKVKEQFNGYIKFCGVNSKNQFVFREEFAHGFSNTIHIDKGYVESTASNEKNIVAQLESCFDNQIYYLCSKPLKLVVYQNNALLRTIIFEKYKNNKPLFLTETENEIIITMQPARLLVISKDDFGITLDLDLLMIHAIEPYFVQKLDDRFLITDSSNSTVRLIDSSLHIYWQYGEFNTPGSLPNQLSVPVNAIKKGDFVVISEQRSHRIIIVDYFTNKIVHQFGVTNHVGCDTSFLWAPQAVFINDSLFVVMCKGANIYIRKVTDDGKNVEDYYGRPVIIESKMNFPRACDYSPSKQLLAVADTYHDQILVFNMEGEIIETINESVIPGLHWPRCVKWLENDLIVANSVLRNIVILDQYYKIKQKIDIPSNFLPNQWIQAVDLHWNIMLIAFETEVILFDINTEEIIWSTQDLQLHMRDIHHAQFLSGNRILISDTGNNRGLLIQDNEVTVIQKFMYKNEEVCLKKPRMMLMNDEYLYIVNSGTSQIYVCNHDASHIKYIFGEGRGLDDKKLSIPRWLCPGIDGMFFISDTDNHRVVLRKFENESNLK